jgi:hypothetical protein
MMPLRGVQAHLRTHNQAPFIAACARYPLLQQHPSMDAVIDAFHRSHTNQTLQDDLLRVMLTEHRAIALGPAQSATYWSLALLAAMRPALARLGEMSIQNSLEIDDFNQLLIEQFLRALLEIDITSPHLLMRLLRGTTRTLSGRLRRERSQSVAHLRLCAQVQALGFNPSDEVDDEDPRDAMEEVFVRLLGESLPSNQLEIVIHTVLQGQRLRGLIKDAGCEYEAEARCEREYQALKRQHSRLLKRVQELMLKKTQCEVRFVRHLIKSRRGGSHHAPTP